MTTIIRLTANLRDGVICLEGALDGLPQLAPQIPDTGPLLKFDLEKVRSVNSLGIACWIQFMDSRKGKTIELHSCPAAFIDAANMISSVTSPKGVKINIVSLQVPYFCESCCRDVLILLRRDEIKVEAGTVKVPRKPCPKCGTPAAEHVDPSDYLGFLLDEN